MKIHGMNRKRNKEFFNPILSNHSGHIDGYYKDIELYGNEPIIIMLEVKQEEEEETMPSTTANARNNKQQYQR